MQIFLPALNRNLRGGRNTFPPMPWLLIISSAVLVSVECLNMCQQEFPHPLL